MGHLFYHCFFTQLLPGTKKNEFFSKILVLWAFLHIWGHRCDWRRNKQVILLRNLAPQTYQQSQPYQCKILWIHLTSLCPTALIHRPRTLFPCFFFSAFCSKVTSQKGWPYSFYVKIAKTHSLVLLTCFIFLSSNHLIFHIICLCLLEYKLYKSKIFPDCYCCIFIIKTVPEILYLLKISMLNK